LSLGAISNFLLWVFNFSYYFVNNKTLLSNWSGARDDNLFIFFALFGLK
jgi:hypothetical protein